MECDLFSRLVGFLFDRLVVFPVSFVFVWFVHLVGWLFTRTHTFRMRASRICKDDSLPS